jgi:hypothetical protein
MSDLPQEHTVLYPKITSEISQRIRPPPLESRHLHIFKDTGVVALLFKTPKEVQVIQRDMLKAMDGLSGVKDIKTPKVLVVRLVRLPTLFASDTFVRRLKLAYLMASLFCLRTA